MAGFNSTGMESCCCSSCFQMLKRYEDLCKAAALYYVVTCGKWKAPERVPIFQCTCNRTIELDENESYRLAER